jgi:signal transduction histidine kinase
MEIRTFLNSHHEIETMVSDNGPGLSAEAIEKVFEPFFTTKGSGMGLGLAISRSIIEDHAGRLWATPNDGPGATFHFTLPRKQQGQGT